MFQPPTSQKSNLSIVHLNSQHTIILPGMAVRKSQNRVPTKSIHLRQRLTKATASISIHPD
jgi:hypothetical protein